MSKHTFTFDPDAGVPYAANLTINTGSDFLGQFWANTTTNTAFDLTGYTGSAQIVKSVAIGATLPATASFSVGFTSAAAGSFSLSMGSTETRTLKEGRYVYDCLVGSASSVYRILNGNVLVLSGISSAPS
jgi:hypothetical protein